jgi:hypothetical protein
MAHAKRAQAKQASKRRRTRTLPVLGAAGVSLAFGGAASAATPTADVPAQNGVPHPVIALGEEEISDVSLATFYVFDKENPGASLDGIKLARGGCGGCGGCRGCGGCAARGCGGGGVGVGCRGCGCGGFRGCVGRGCVGRGCGCGGWWGGGCGGCGGGCGSCWQWTPIGWIILC